MALTPEQRTTLQAALGSAVVTNGYSLSDEELAEAWASRADSLAGAIRNLLAANEQAARPDQRADANKA